MTNSLIAGVLVTAAIVMLSILLMPTDMLIAWAVVFAAIAVLWAWVVG